MPTAYQVIGGRYCDILVQGWDGSASETGCILEPEHTGNCRDAQGKECNNQVLFRPRPGIINWTKIRHDIRNGTF